MYTEKVLEIIHYSDRLFRFKTTRNQGFRFENGEFAMIGLELEPKPIFRAYSIVSTCYDDHLEFLSIKVPDGPLTSRLQHIKVGDDILLKPKTTGSLVIDYVHAKQNLVMLSTGTGIAPFMSIVRDFRTYDRFENVYLFHTVRETNELAYHQELTQLQTDLETFHYIESVTQQPYHRPGRFWDHIPEVLPGGLDKERDSVMVCGSPSLNSECRELFHSQDWSEGNMGENGDFMLERAFAD